jgi:proteasome lid subunit RPN8/RPN11
MSLNKEFEDRVIEHARDCPDEEVCGFILLDNDLTVRVERSINENPNPRECFSISPSKFIDYKINKIILGIYHSHPRTSEKPSRSDMEVSEEMGMPYLIYSLKTGKFFLYYPTTYEPPPLLMRPYIKGFYECTCILKDYFKQELNIDISKWNKNYWLPEEDKDANKLLNRILNKNLNKVKDKSINKNDIIVFEVKKGKRFHIGIYCDNDEFVHQTDNTLSRKQMLDDRWQNKIKDIYRHPSLV